MMLLLVAATILLLGLPLLPAILEWRRKADSEPLRITPTHLMDRRSAAAAFGSQVRSVLTEAIATYTARGIEAPHGSPIAESFDVFRGPGASEGLARTGRPAILLSFEPIPLPSGLTTARPAYIAGTLHTGADSQFEALFADGAIHLGPSCRVLKWVHADADLRVEADCHLAGSASSNRSIRLLPGTRFERLEAPDIRFGDDWHWSGTWQPSANEEGPRPLLRLLRRSERLGDGRVISGDLSIPPGHAVEGDLVIRGNLRMGRGAVIRGSIKTHGRVLTGAGSRIQGSLFARGGITFGADTRIGGVLSSEADIHLHWGSVLGSPDGPVTVTGRRILVDQGVRVHGVMAAVEAGMVASRTTARRAA